MSKRFKVIWKFESQSRQISKTMDSYAGVTGCLEALLEMCLNDKLVKIKIIDKNFPEI